MGTKSCKVRKGSQQTTEKSPTEQAYGYALAYREQLRKTKELTRPAGHEHAGDLIFPVNYCVVFRNIARKDAGGLTRVLGDNLCLFKDDLEFDSRDDESRREFLSKLKICALRSFLLSSIRFPNNKGEPS